MDAKIVSVDLELLRRLLHASSQMVSHINLNSCSHESTVRGGGIWEICEDCGARWADDRGGKPPNAGKTPAYVLEAEDVIPQLSQIFTDVKTVEVEQEDTTPLELAVSLLQTKELKTELREKLKVLCKKLVETC